QSITKARQFLCFHSKARRRTMLFTMNRRSFLKRTATGSRAFVAGLAMPAIVRAQARPVITHGLQSGDVNASSAMIWARVDRPAQMLVEVATTDSFKDAVKLAPVNALPDSDLTVKRLLADLPS